jgi:AraC-like DNA-binding protein
LRNSIESFPGKPLPLDFDIYAATLRGRGQRLILRDRSQGPWKVRTTPVGPLTIEFREEGGSTIMVGQSALGSLTFAVLTSGTLQGGLLNGHHILSRDTIVIPPGQELIESVPAPHRWLSIALPLDAMHLLEPELRETFTRLLTLNHILVLHSRTLTQRITAGAAVAGHVPVQTREGVTFVDQTSGTDLVAVISIVAIAALDGAERRPDFTRGHGTNSYELASRTARQLNGLDGGWPKASELCRVLNVSERQVRRSLKSYFGVGPAKLATLHRLNQVREILVGGVSESTKVMDVLSDCCVTEGGRFAGEYRGLFGEFPSETRRRHLLTQARMGPSSPRGGFG